MRLTVLVNSQRLVSRLGTGTSYLVAGGGANIVLDAANGAERALRIALGGRGPDAVVVSHFHADMLHDLVPVALALPEGGRLFLPTGSRKRFEQLLDAIDAPVERFGHLRVEDRGPGAEDAVGGLRLRWGPANHGCLGTSLRVDGDGASLAVVGDTGEVPALADFARGASLLVAHAPLLDGEDAAAARTNLTAGAAGRLARAAGVRRLALAHPPFHARVDETVDEATREFGGPVVVLAEGETYAV
ncbi:MAG TPA: MBL fold metallo-hydrolase [Candidatus Thermoplasmatota archaeon]|nr:MBL fold metallo-hydrolase [Candidatus Thermoplasmatota archaeon]